jgi:pimeloyl-ACP methyl ester carboxylesterase
MRMLVRGNLVLLHGLGSTIKDWDFQIPVLSEKFRLIIPDFRGHGESGINNDDFELNS